MLTDGRYFWASRDVLRTLDTVSASEKGWRSESSGELRIPCALPAPLGAAEDVWDSVLLAAEVLASAEDFDSVTGAGAVVGAAAGAAAGAVLDFDSVTSLASIPREPKASCRVEAEATLAATSAETGAETTF